MEDWRSKSCGDGRMQIGGYGNGTMPPFSGMHDLRSYSTSYVSTQETKIPKEMKFKKGRGSSSSSSKWCFSDPELQRKKRVAGYKVYGVEGKMKGSFRKSFRWLKDKYTQVVYGWW